MVKQLVEQHDAALDVQVELEQVLQPDLHWVPFSSGLYPVDSWSVWRVCWPL